MSFYNTAPPTPTTKNNITDIAVTYGIRDFLLNKNLLPVYPQISTSLNGSPKIGQPVLDTSINGNANVIPDGLPLETEGIFRYEIAVLPNQFKNVDSNAPSLLNIDDVSKITGVFGDVNFPQGVQNYPTSSSEQIEQYGLIGKTEYAGFRKKSTIKNLYLDSSSQTDMADYISLQPAGFSQQINGYLNTYGGLNLGSPSVAPTSIIGNLLDTQGLGLAKGGVINFDFKAAIGGRTLGTNGLVNDTKLGMIGAQQLSLSLANNAAFNTVQAIEGSLNTQDNILSLVKGGPLPGFRPNYQITKPASDLDAISDYASRILGFTVPRSYMTDGGSIFQSESGEIGNIERANNLLVTTGKGQIQALITNIFANQNGSSPTGIDNPTYTQFRTGYAPGYANSKGELQITDGKLYAYNIGSSIMELFCMSDSKGGESTIPTLSYNKDLGQYGFKSPDELAIEQSFIGFSNATSYDDRVVSTVGFSWGTEYGGLTNSSGDYSTLRGDKKSLLTKTQKLFNSYGMKTIVTSKGDMNNSSSQITQANGYGFSKGSAVLNGNLYYDNGVYKREKNKTADETYCRSWTTTNRYDQVKKLIRHSGLYGEGNVPYRFQTQNTVLEEYGFPKIAPYTSDINTYAIGKDFVVGDPKNFMFSIENLAWHDKTPDLPPVEIGMGDLVTGKRGRIMWFPPYNIQFNETSNVEWESNKFIGRGEPVYTYNNTERSGTLSFTIIVDHPSYVNSFTDVPEDNYVASFFAGCVDPNDYFYDKLTVSEKDSISQSLETSVQQTVLTPETPPAAFNIYFPNDTSSIDDLIAKKYEDGLSGLTASDKIDYEENKDGYPYGIGLYTGNTTGGTTSSTGWFDGNNYGLNGWYRGVTSVGDVNFSGFTDPAYGPALKEYLTNKCPHCTINISSYASPQGNAASNKTLSELRTQATKQYLKKLLDLKDDSRFGVLKSEPLTGTACITGKNKPTDTFECKIDRKSTVTFVFDNQKAANEMVKPQPTTKKVTTRVNTKITNRLYDESKYFEKLTDENKFVFDSFRERIKYFHPAFHSTTPEGLNSRLTFLHQCTRQGPTLESQGANNLAFGRPPVCILRIGDFYNTKIIIDNLTIDYEPLIWDLNPEGVGVQPMMANVNLSFKFIGGSTLMGPINKLQNALSFNYYANAHVYDPRADYVAIKENNTYGIVSGATMYRTGNNYFEVSKPINNSENTFELNQIKANEDVLGNQVESENTPSGSTLSLIDVTYNKDNSSKSNGFWYLNVILTVKDSTGDLNSDATSLIKDGYTLSISSIKNPTELYGILLNNQSEMVNFISPGYTSTTFLVPIKGENGNKTGLTDYFGKSSFVLSLSKNGLSIKTINIKLK